MGTNQSQFNVTMTYPELSNAVFRSLKREVFDEAEYISDPERRQKFLESNLKDTVKERYDKFSSLSLDFGTQQGIDLIETIGYKVIPNIRSLNLYHVGDSPGRLERLLKDNFPEKVDNLSILQANMNISTFSIHGVSHIIRKRISKSLRMSGFEMSCYNLESLLTMGHNLKRINFRGCKLVDNEEIILEEDYDNLEELNLEGIGLSKFNIENIGKLMRNCS